MSLERQLKENDKFMQEIYSYAEGFVDTTESNTWDTQNVIENYYASEHYLKELFEEMAEEYDVDDIDEIKDSWILILEEEIEKRFEV